MKEKIHYIYIWFDYRVILPFFAILPNKLGRFLATLRGKFYYHKKRDWRSFTFNDYELFNRSYRSYQIMFPEYSHKEILELVQQRYVYQCLEEYESAQINNRTYHNIGVEYLNKKAVDKFLSENEKAIFTTCHFGSIVGLTYLHIFNKPTLHMASNVTKQSNVHPTITNFYIKKYLVGNEYMNGGEILDVEGNHKRFLKLLKQGGCISSVADIPSADPNNESHWQSFFGKERAFSSGIERLSKSTKTKVIPYVCYFDNGRYIMKFANLDEDVFSFFENEIKQRPGMWWAADLLDAYATR